MKWVLGVFFSLTLVALPLRAQSESTGDERVVIRQLLEKIQRLEQRIDELEKNQRLAALNAPVVTRIEPAPARSEPAQPRAGEIDSPISHEPELAALPQQSTASAPQAESVAPQTPVPAPPEATSEEHAHLPTLTMHGFADVDFSAQDAKGTTSGFNMGQFVLHLASPLTDKVNVFGELSLTATPRGYNAEVERALIRYDYSDFLKVSFGRYHTPINYWNTAFHHGLWLQTTAARPEMIQFGGRLIPVHFVGALAEGRVPGTGSLNLNYNVGLGNGRGEIISRPGDAGDVNNHRAWLVTVFAKPDWAYGWQVGGSVYRDKITRTPSRNFYEWIESAHVVYTKERPELLAEFANIHHTSASGPGVFNSQAWYVQLAYRLPYFEQVLKPYYRYEYIHVPLSEPVFNLPGAPFPSFNGSVLGLRYDISRYAAFKAEYRNSSQSAGEPRVNGAFVQTAFTF